MDRIARRTLLGLGARALGLGALGVAAAACGAAEDAGVSKHERFAYGTDPSQYAELYRPEGVPRGVVVVIHGGFWRAQYDASLGAPLASSLAAEGWAAWNLEYRRVGNGGGVPQTLDDVAAGIDLLAEQDLDLSTVLALGHSAGGHLAAWAAARGRFDRWSPAVVPLTGVLSQAGVLDLRAAAAADLGGGAVPAFVGGSPEGTVDPAQQLPLEVPVRCIHGRDDTTVPIEQSRSYVSAARRAGADAGLTEVVGDHFTLIDVDSPVWATQLDLLEKLRSPE